VLITALGTLTIVLHQVKTWPQTIRILRRRDAIGVSALTWSLVLTGNLTWVVYGMALGDLVLIVTNVGAAVAAAAVLVAMARQRAAPGGLAGWVVLGTVGFAVGLDKVAGTPTLAAVAVGLVMVMFMPQAVKVFRAPVSGVSPATWWLQVVSSAV
jgi:uncharacterized protein with PQ loop repeat